MTNKRPSSPYKTKCPICSNDKPCLFQTIDTITNVKRLQCLHCECIFFDNRLHDLPDYNLEYNKHFFRPTDIRKAGILAHNLATLLEHQFRSPLILEIGPGNGLTSFLLKIQGFDIEICDSSPDTCTFLSNTYSLKTHCSTFETIVLPFTYDFIFASHVVEHTHNPHDFFSNIALYLKTHGLFYFDTPNVDYWKLYGKNWKHFKTRNPYEHSCMLSIKTVYKISDLFNLDIFDLRINDQYQSLEVTFIKNK